METEDPLFASVAVALLASTFIPVVMQFYFYIPAYWCLRRAGWSGWWFVAMAIPILGLLFLWWFAFGRWPNEYSKEHG